VLALLPPPAAGLASRGKPPDYRALQRRLDSRRAAEADVQCLALDAMLPRQRAQLTFGPPLSSYVRECRDAGAPLCVLGMDGAGRLLRRGVEARVESMSPFTASNGYFSSHSMRRASGFTAYETCLVGGRRFELLELLPTPAGSKWHKPTPPPAWPPTEVAFHARVRWLEDEAPGAATAAAVLQAEALVPRIAEWLHLVRSTARERTDGQLGALLRDLGPRPAADEADDLALWAAALLNPLPPLGVARDVRPAVLRADAPLERLVVVSDALAESIERMRRVAPGPIEAEPPRRDRDPESEQ
jgi:hypothetical protein